MASLVRQWSLPLVHAHDSEAKLTLNTTVTRIERDALDATRWQLRTEGTDRATEMAADKTADMAVDGGVGAGSTGNSACVHSGFDVVLLALPAAPAAALLKASRVAVKLANAIAKVDVAPCWTLMVAFPNASQPGVPHLGPQWNAARSTHHRAAWLARESSKPGRDRIERWTLQASAAWSQEHLDDDSARVQGKLLKAFADITGIRATPAHAETYRWRDAQTIKPLGQSHLWDAKTGIGVAGDWCIGHRVEDAFVSGLELALAVNG
jgi:predicted NAD/FAD-dependent oxidoreductase